MCVLLSVEGTAQPGMSFLGNRSTCFWLDICPTCRAGCPVEVRSHPGPTHLCLPSTVTVRTNLVLEEFWDQGHVLMFARQTLNKWAIPPAHESQFHILLLYQIKKSVANSFSKVLCPIIYATTLFMFFPFYSILFFHFYFVLSFPLLTHLSYSIYSLKSLLHIPMSLFK